MSEVECLDGFLAGARVAADVVDLRPDYRALVVAVDGLGPGPSDDAVGALIQAAQDAARGALAGTEVEEIPHVAQWREACRGFGAKPRRACSSLEALLRRAASGLPRVNGLTDRYDAVSVLHQTPIGGGGAGPVPWCAAAGRVHRQGTLRYRRGRRRRGRAPGALTAETLHATADDVVAHLRRLGPDVPAARRLLAVDSSAGGPGAVAARRVERVVVDRYRS